LIEIQGEKIHGEARSGRLFRSRKAGKSPSIALQVEAEGGFIEFNSVYY